MRYSESPRVAPKRYPEDISAADMLADVTRENSPESLRGALLLVGGRDPRALALRRAQAVVRYDRRPAYFSHAALLVEWNSEQPQASQGLEVTLEPQNPLLQVPERNGVTAFRLERYLDAQRYPNLALLTLELEDEREQTEDGTAEVARASAVRKTDALDAAHDPCRQRDTFPLWDGLATWAAYAYAPETTPNPLLHNVPLPSAAFVEYAYAAAGIDLVPSASSNHACPELLWATALHFQPSLAGLRLRASALIRDEHAIPPAALPMRIGGAGQAG